MTRIDTNINRNSLSAGLDGKELTHKAWVKNVEKTLYLSKVLKSTFFEVLIEMFQQPNILFLEGQKRFERYGKWITLKKAPGQNVLVI